MDLAPQQLVTLLGEEKSIDPEDVRDELKTILLKLKAALKLDKDWDFSAVILSLIAEQGPVQLLCLPTFRDY